MAASRTAGATAEAAPQQTACAGHTGAWTILHWQVQHSQVSTGTMLHHATICVGGFLQQDHLAYSVRMMMYNCSGCYQHYFYSVHATG
jgi:hypothetical protein